MGMNDTPSGERLHIGIFGRRNVGKSSIINAITGQSLSIVSHIKGTTTDPVSKAMELLPLGPVVLIDTPGLDDVGELGEKRIQKSYQALHKTDIAVLVTDGGTAAGENEDSQGYPDVEKRLLETFKEKGIPYLIAVNKSESMEEDDKQKIRKFFIEEKNLIFVSAVKSQNVTELKDLIAKQMPKENEHRLVGDLLTAGDFVVLVIPIDSAAPKGRLILPQQQVIRDCLEAAAIPIITRETELKETLAGLGKKPKVVVTDSQVFGLVDKETPKDIYLTSFSILLSRYKGDLGQQVDGAKALDGLKDGDTVLISEGCTHHRQCNDIGTVKMPNWISEYTGKKLNFAYTSGTEFPQDLSPYAVVVHCGGCMLNEREMKYRISHALRQGKPITNYGTAIAYMHGILKRSVEMFPEIL